MLQSISDRAQSWITWVIVVILAVAFSLWGVENYFNSSAGSNVVVEVNGNDITREQVDTLYKRLQTMQRSKQDEITAQSEQNLKHDAIKQLVRTQVLTNNSITQGYRIVPQQIQSVLANIPAFQQDGRFSLDRFQTVLNNLAYTYNDFIAQLQADMLNYQPQVGIVGSDFALLNEVNAVYQLLNQKRDISYVVIPLEKFKAKLNASQNISEQDMQAYYKKHADKFKVPEQVSIEYLLLNKADLKQGQTFTDTELQQYYNDNIGNFTAPAQWHVAHIFVKVPKDATPEQQAAAKAKIDNISKQLTSGESFTKLVSTDSEDIASAKSGGELPWFAAGSNMADPAIEKAVAQLKPEQVSQPIRTQLGYSIIKVLAVKPKEVRPFTTVKEQITTALAQEKSQAMFAQMSDRLADLTYTHADSLTIAAESLTLPILSTPLFTKKVAAEGILSNPKIIAAAFADNTLNQGFNSDVIEVSPETLVVLRVKQHKPAVVEPFEKVKDTIKQDLQFEQAKAKINEFGESIVNALKQGMALDQVAKKFQITWLSFPSLKRTELPAKLDAKITEAAFANKLTGILLPNGDYAVVKVNKVAAADPNQMSVRERTTLNEELAQSFGQLDYQFYTNQILREAKVKFTNPQDAVDLGS